MAMTTPELTLSLQISPPYQREDVWTPMYDLTCNRPHTRRISSGIGFRTSNENLPLDHRSSHLV
ncbi:hypothetical protein AVEN_41480-1, partial [Araneus ventricosus]